MKRTLFSFPVVKALLFLLLAVPALWSCNTETAYMKSLREQADAYKVIDDDTIQSYIRRNGYTSTVQTTSTGLSIVPIATGPTTGKAVTAGSQVRIRYIGRFLNNSYDNSLFPPGGIFENSSENHSNCGCAVLTAGVASPFGQGFSDGLLTMREGDRKLLLIPSRLAFSTTGQSNAAGTGYIIPPNSTLSFDVEILNVL